MKEFTIRPLASNGNKILTDDLILLASSVLTAKVKAEMICPDADKYEVIDINESGFTELKQLEKKYASELSQ